MASITTILLTDSLASSRIVMNDNFAAINDELTDIASLLDVSAQTLTLIGTVNAGGLNLANGGSNTFVVNSSDIIASLPLTVEGSLTLDGPMRHSISDGITSLPAANAYVKTTYIVDATAFSGAQTLNVADSGQTVTFIADGGDFQISSANIAGPTLPVVIHDNGSLTLRFYDSLWYVISYANADVTF